MATHICPNCNNNFTEQFCNRCGQKVVHRITMKHLWHDLTHAFTHADKGFFYLMGQLFVRPGVVAREYIVEGKRKRYFTPLQYLILLGTIATIIVVNSHFIEHTAKSMGEFTGTNTPYSGKKGAIMQKAMTTVSKYYNAITLLQLPFYAFAAFIFYRRLKYNFAELLTLQTFITAQHTILSMVIMLFIFITNTSGYLNIAILSVSLIYHIWMYQQFFQQKGVAGFFRALGSYLLGIILFFLFAILLGAIIGMFIGIINR